MHKKNSNSVIFALPWEVKHAGGINQVVLNLMRQCENAELYRPILFVADWDKSNFQCDEDDGYLTVRGRMLGKYKGAQWIKKIIHSLKQCYSLFQLWHFIKKNRVSVVNLHNPDGFCRAFYLLRKFGIADYKIVLSVHGYEVSEMAKLNGAEYDERVYYFNNADAIVACSYSLKEKAVSVLPFLESKISVVHNGVDVERVNNQSLVTELLSPIDGRPYLLNLATFEHKKGQDVLISAFDAVAEQFPDLCLVICGRETPYLNKLKIKMNDSAYSHRIFLHDNCKHSDAMALMKSAKLFILPSRSEPFGIVLLEAGVFNVPVVASHTGGIVEIIEDGVDGFLVAVEDVGDLSEKIRMLLCDSELSISLGNKLGQKVRRTFSWEQAYLKYKILYRKGYS